MKKYFFIFIACFFIFILHLIVSGHGIYGDGNGFYSYTHSIIFEKSLDFGPIYEYLESFQGPKYTFSRVFWNASLGPLGIYKNPFPIGTGILWIPSVYIINLFIQDRFSVLLEIGPGITGILFAVAGLYYTQKYLEFFFKKNIANWGSILFFVCSNLFYYASLEPALSHQPAFFIVAYLLYKSQKPEDKFLNYFIIGALSGVLFMTRLADVILLVPVYYNLLKSKPKWDHFIMAPLGAILFSAPLFASYYLMYGSVLSSPYITGASGNFTVAFYKIAEFFLSAKRGLFIWTPIYLLSLVGLYKSKKYLYLIALSALFLVCSFWSANTSAGFGQRFVISGAPYFTFGMCSLIKKWSFKKSAVVFLVIFVWNVLTLFQFYADSRSLIRNENLTIREFVVGQFTTPIKSLNTISRNGLNDFVRNQVLD